MKKTDPLVKTAWDLFSKMVRIEECLETTGTPEYGFCCTCRMKFHITRLDAGHFIPSRTNSVLFNRDLVHIQCRQCNGEKDGNIKEYERFMVDRYGQDKVDEFKRLRFKTGKLTKDDLDEIIKSCNKFLEKYPWVKNQLSSKYQG